MNGKRIIVLGSSFAGLTAALDLKQKLGKRHPIVVISKTDRFLFTPSLACLPFGLCSVEEISFPIRGILEEQGIEFKQSEVTALNPDQRSVTTKTGVHAYDHLVIATGTNPNFGAVPGLGPRGYSHSIATLPEAQRAAAALPGLEAAPGPVVIGGVQGTHRMNASYEFLFNMAHWLRKRHLGGKIPLTYVTPGSEEISSGTGTFESQSIKQLFKEFEIRRVTRAAIQRVQPTEIHLADGQILPFSYAMLMPSSLGVEVLRDCHQITNALGLVQVNPVLQALQYPEIFGAGMALTMEGAARNVAATPYLSEKSAKVVAHNIAANINGQAMIPLHSGQADDMNETNEARLARAKYLFQAASSPGS